MYSGFFVVLVLFVLFCVCDFFAKYVHTLVLEVVSKTINDKHKKLDL